MSGVDCVFACVGRRASGCVRERKGKCVSCTACVSRVRLEQEHKFRAKQFENAIADKARKILNLETEVSLLQLAFLHTVRTVRTYLHLLSLRDGHPLCHYLMTVLLPSLQIEVMEGELRAAREAARKSPARTTRDLVERLKNDMATKEKQYKVCLVHACVRVHAQVVFFV